MKVTDIHKIERKNSVGISVFGYENKKKYPIYVSKTCCEDKYVDSLLIGEGKKSTMFLSKTSTHLYTITQYIVEENIFFCYCLQAFRPTDVLKYHINDCFKINDNQRIKMPMKSEYVKFRNYDRKIKSPFMIYSDFESVLVLKIMKIKIQTSFIQTNIKNMLLVVMATN